MILPGCCVAAGLGPRSSSMTSDTNESQKCNQHFYMDSYSIVRQGDSQIAQHLPQNGQKCHEHVLLLRPGAGSVLDSDDESRWLWHLLTRLHLQQFAAALIVVAAVAISVTAVCK